MIPQEAEAYMYQLGLHEPTVQMAESPKLTIEFSHAEVELVKTHIKVFAKHCRYYVMILHSCCEICKPAQVQSVLLYMLFPTDQMSKTAFNVPVN